MTLLSSPGKDILGSDNTQAFQLVMAVVKALSVILFSVHATWSTFFVGKIRFVVFFFLVGFFMVQRQTRVEGYRPVSGAVFFGGVNEVLRLL